MQPGRPAGHHLQRLHRRAGGGQHREARRPWRRRRRPSPCLDQCRPMPLARGQRPANAGRGDELVLRPVAPEHLADLEQRRHRESRGRHCACAAATRPGSRLGRMSDRSAAIGLASASSGWPPPNNSACALGNERPRHRLDQAARGERALGAAGAQLDRRQHRLARRRRRARTASSAPCRRRRCARSPRRCRPCRATSGRHDGTATFTTRPWPATMKPRCSEHAAHFGERHVDAGEPLELRSAGNRSRARRRSALPATTFSDGVPPQSSITMRVAISRPGTMKAGSTPRSKR